jgi:hypothetical protein
MQLYEALKETSFGIRYSLWNEGDYITESHKALWEIGTLEKPDCRSHSSEPKLVYSFSQKKTLKQGYSFEFIDNMCGGGRP